MLHRFTSLLLFLIVCWFGMETVHELGHVLAAWGSRATVERVVLLPISRTDIAGVEHPPVRLRSRGRLRDGVALALMVGRPPVAFEGRASFPILRRVLPGCQRSLHRRRLFNRRANRCRVAHRTRSEPPRPDPVRPDRRRRRAVPLARSVAALFSISFTLKRVVAPVEKLLFFFPGNIPSFTFFFGIRLPIVVDLKLIHAAHETFGQCFPV